MLEVCLKDLALTHVQSMPLSALSYEMCSYTSISFENSIFLQKCVMFYNISFKCHILNMGCFKVKLSNFKVKHHISFGFQKILQLGKLYK